MITTSIVGLSYWGLLRVILIKMQTGLHDTWKTHINASLCSSYFFFKVKSGYKNGFFHKTRVLFIDSNVRSSSKKKIVFLAACWIGMIRMKMDGLEWEIFTKYVIFTMICTICTSSFDRLFTMELPSKSIQNPFNWAKSKIRYDRLGR